MSDQPKKSPPTDPQERHEENWKVYQRHLAKRAQQMPGKSMEELYVEGKISAHQYRSVLFLMKTGPSFCSNPDDASLDIDKKIEELTQIIEAQRIKH